MPDTRRIFIVSNRLPLSIESEGETFNFKRSSGGLVAGLNDVHNGVHRHAQSIWVGHSGIFQDQPRYESVTARLLADRYLAVAIAQDEYDGYYAGMANGTLWPLFHYFPAYMRYDERDWIAYVRVNQRFTDTILSMAQPGDLVWVHDYQLMLVPGMLRHASPELRIAYFHHIPFPSSEMFRILTRRDEILQGVLGADLVGLHTLDYVRHFLTCVTRILGGDVDRDAIHYQRRIVKVGAFPLGVDVESTRDRVKNSEAVAGMTELSRSVEGKLVFLGIDRLDYTKGIPERLKAFQIFLRKHPECVDHTAFVQVCVPSRQDAPNYAELRSEVERLVGQINGEFGRPGYVPLQYLYQPFSPEQVVAFYRLGDVMLVTPLRDGLNLVCKEFVASRRDDDGVLILSEFAGAAAEMGEALLVNPYNVDRLADSMYEAARMEPEERRRRMQLLRRRVTSYNNVEWAKDFMRAWDEASPTIDSRSGRLEGAARAELIEAVSTAVVKRLFLDYDGTLTPIRRNPTLATPTPDLLALLQDLGRRPDFDVTIITGRSREFCDQYFAGIDLNLVAEHCAFYRRKGGGGWESVVSAEEFERIKAVVRPHLDSYVRRIPGAFVEEKETALVLHYREAEPIFAHAQALDLKESLTQILANTPYSAFRAKKAIEMKPAAANKATAVEQLLQESEHGDAVFVTAGDDLVDEDMFRVRADRNLSIHIGQVGSVARYYLDAPADLHALLKELVNPPPGQDSAGGGTIAMQMAGGPY
ncbi:MAG: bifunctional alpha,alpha-trehalose-phosphate synthase (UDP-forming)/trehalose-phosphatase [Pseudomonadota bacterium]|nr:bifunctional alpha,alpha-trehalose-phosphate synthase (UDP-forming)/trehalose-phosphatase [Pseudomonadota bacterium]